MKFHFLPRKDNFLVLFADGARNAVQAARLLKDLVDSYIDVGEKSNQITEVEHTGDSITHQIMAQLHRTFITPFDREDIAALASSLDNVTDFIEAAADTMVLYKIETPSPEARELADVIVRSTVAVEAAISQLKHGTRSKQILETCVEINRLENEADKIFRSARAELFDNSKDIAHVMKWHEIYQLLESATDRCEDVSDIIEGIVLKHA